MQEDLDHLLAIMGEEFMEVHYKAFRTISARRDEERNKVIYDLASKSRHEITGRGVVYVVDNPRDTKSDDWSWIINHKVRIDGKTCLVTGVERQCIGGIYGRGRPIGLLVKEIE